MGNTLKELGEQYAREADNLDQLITQCRQNKTAYLRQGKSADAARQERLIELHAQQRSDLLKLAAWLRHYYGTKEASDVGD